VHQSSKINRTSSIQVGFFPRLNTMKIIREGEKSNVVREVVLFLPSKLKKQ